MKQLSQFFALILTLFLVSCSSLPSRDVLVKEAQNVKLPLNEKPGYGMVYVVRPGMFGGLIRFNVFINSKEDSAEIGWNRGSQHIYFYAKPGEHLLYSKAENWREIKINVKEGEPVFVKQIAEFGFIMARNTLEEIDVIEGKYHLKKTELGTINNTDTNSSK